MNEKSTIKGKDGMGARKAGSRKRSYRPVQYGLVVIAFLASFMGTVWLQRQEASANDGLLASNTALTTLTLPSATTDDAFAVPTDAVVAVVPTTADDDQEESESEWDEEESESVTAALPTPFATLPAQPTSTPAPTVQESAPSAQLAAPRISRSTRAVARSRSSR
jgi:hypothetical protein